MDGKTDHDKKSDLPGHDKVSDQVQDGRDSQGGRPDRGEPGNLKSGDPNEPSDDDGFIDLGPGFETIKLPEFPHSKVSASSQAKSREKGTGGGIMGAVVQKKSAPLVYVNKDSLRHGAMPDIPGPATIILHETGGFGKPFKFPASTSGLPTIEYGDRMMYKRLEPKWLENEQKTLGTITVKALTLLLYAPCQWPTPNKKVGLAIIARAVNAAFALGLWNEAARCCYRVLALKCTQFSHSTSFHITWVRLFLNVIEQAKAESPEGEWPDEYVALLVATLWPITELFESDMVDKSTSSMLYQIKQRLFAWSARSVERKYHMDDFQEEFKEPDKKFGSGPYPYGIEAPSARQGTELELERRLMGGSKTPAVPLQQASGSTEPVVAKKSMPKPGTNPDKIFEVVAGDKEIKDKLRNDRQTVLWRYLNGEATFDEAEVKSFSTLRAELEGTITTTEPPLVEEDIGWATGLLHRTLLRLKCKELAMAVQSSGCANEADIGICWESCEEFLKFVKDSAWNSPAALIGAVDVYRTCALFQKVHFRNESITDKYAPATLRSQGREFLSLRHGQRS